MIKRTILFATLLSCSIGTTAAPLTLTDSQMDNVVAAGTSAYSFAAAYGIATSAGTAGGKYSFAGSRAFGTNHQLGVFNLNGGAALSIACCGDSSSGVSGAAYGASFNQLGLSISIGVVGL